MVTIPDENPDEKRLIRTVVARKGQPDFLLLETTGTEAEDKAIYSFEIKTAENKTMEVEVDVNTGEVLEVENGDDKD